MAELDRKIAIAIRIYIKNPMHKQQSGKLRIGDDWNAITVIALSQQSPLKAVAELVENCIDAHASKIVITRGKERGAH